MEGLRRRRSPAAAALTRGLMLWKSPELQGLISPSSPHPGSAPCFFNVMSRFHPNKHLSISSSLIFTSGLVSMLRASPQSRLFGRKMRNLRINTRCKELFEYLQIRKQTGDFRRIYRYMHLECLTSFEMRNLLNCFAWTGNYPSLKDRNWQKRLYFSFPSPELPPDIFHPSIIGATL